MQVLRRTPLLAAALALAGCAALAERAQRADITIVNAVAWPDSVTGAMQRERSRLSLDDAHGRTEHYPLMQVKRCDEGGRNCVWGVARVEGTISVQKVAGDAVDLQIAMHIDVGRRQAVALPGFHMALEIPQDITAFSQQRLVTHALHLPYGETRAIDLDFGIRLNLCVARRDSPQAAQCEAG